MSEFIPSVIIFGDENELPNDLGVRYKIIGKLRIEDQTIFFNDQQIQLQHVNYLPFDYILCSNRKIYEDNISFLKKIASGKVCTTNFFRRYVSNVGYTNLMLTFDIIKMIKDTSKIKTVLDLDGYFYRSGSFDYPQSWLEQSELNFSKTILMDGIIQDQSDMEPIYKNLYTEIFSNFDEIKLRHYDIVLVTAERSIDEWNQLLNWTIKFADVTFAFIHQDSIVLPMLKNLQTNAKIEWKGVNRGEWLILRRTSNELCQAFVSVHKKWYMTDLPERYFWIQAGKKNSNVDLGFQGDDTGDNISEYNKSINEITVMYWVWKNTRSDYVGFSMYRRFFAIKDYFSVNRSSKNYVPIGENYEHIMTTDEAKKLLRDCDIIVGIPTGNVSAFDLDHREYNSPIYDDDDKVREWKVYLKYFKQYQPEYFDALDKVESSNMLITNNMFFTRWELFDEYCKFIFSILLPTVQELQSDNRHVGFRAEQAFAIFCMHNNLRIKYIPILLYNHLESTKETFDPKKFKRLNYVSV